MQVVCCYLPRSVAQVVLWRGEKACDGWTPSGGNLALRAATKKRAPNQVWICALTPWKAGQKSLEELRRDSGGLTALTFGG